MTGWDIREEFFTGFTGCYTRFLLTLLNDVTLHLNKEFGMKCLVIPQITFQNAKSPLKSVSYLASEVLRFLHIGFCNLQSFQDFRGNWKNDYYLRVTANPTGGKEQNLHQLSLFCTVISHISTVPWATSVWLSTLAEPGRPTSIKLCSIRVAP